MNKYIFKISILVIIFLMTSCNANSTKSGHSISTPVYTSATAENLTTNNTSTLPVPRASATFPTIITLSETPVPNPGKNIYKSCLVFEDALVSESLQGKLMLDFDGTPNKAFLRNMETGVDLNVPNDPYFAPNNFVVSPDFEWLAFGAAEKGSSDKLIIQSQDRNERFIYKQDYKVWDTIAYWVDNQWLVLQKHDEPHDRFTLFNSNTR